MNQPLLTPEDSKRVADAVISAVETALHEMTRRHDAMCAQIEQTVYVKNNPTRF